MVIHKFAIKIEDRPVVSMDPNGRVVSFGEQHGNLFVWAIVDPNAEHKPRHFQLCSTGYPLRGNQRYIGTAQLHNGDLVFHLLEELAPAQPNPASPPEERQHPETVGHKPHGPVPTGDPRPMFNRGGPVARSAE